MANNNDCMSWIILPLQSVFERNMMIVSYKKAAKIYKLITYLEFLLFQVCRQAGYFKHAVYLAEKYDQHDL